MRREPRSIISKLALRAGCSRQLVDRLLKRGLTEEQICQHVEENRARQVRQRAAWETRRAGGYVITSVAARELGISRSRLWCRRKEGLTDDQIRVVTLYHRALRQVPRAERQAFFRENPPPPFVKLGCGGRPKKPRPPRPLRHCDECGAQIPPDKPRRRRFCSKACYHHWTSNERKRKNAETLAAQPARFCLECGAQFAIVSGQQYIKVYCSRVCAERARARRERDKATHNGHKDGLLVTMSIARTWPGRSTLVFTPAGIKFVSACLMTSLTFPAIATLLGIRFDSFKYLLKRTPELTPYRERHYEIQREEVARKAAEHNVKYKCPAICTRCGGRFMEYRRKSDLQQRLWCDKCHAPKPKTRTPEQLEERRRKAREDYHKNAESERQHYREYYASNREKEVERTRRYKAIKRHGLDPEKWREQWELLQDYKSRGILAKKRSHTHEN